MKLLTISLIISCNFRCYYCPVKHWLVPKNVAPEKINVITNEALFKWLDAYIDPQEWIIEITGGEPGLYPEIQTLILALSDKGYRGVIKTNGSLPIPQTTGFSRVAAWHEGKGFPAHYDQILVIQNPNDKWEEKVAFCEQHNIPYKTSFFDRRFEGVRFDNSVCSVNRMLGITHVNSSGMITGCSIRPRVEEVNILNMSSPVPFLGLPSDCPRCKPVNDVEKFLPPDLIERLERDYRGYTARAKEPISQAELNRRLAKLNTEENKARAVIDEDFAVEWKAKIANILAVKEQSGWPIEIVWPE